ncbi:MAG: hypothetical protein WCV90_08055 [Candidatus Woesearchaeota archaeon]
MADQRELEQRVLDILVSTTPLKEEDKRFVTDYVSGIIRRYEQKKRECKHGHRRFSIQHVIPLSGKRKEAEVFGYCAHCGEPQEYRVKYK